LAPITKILTGFVLPNSLAAFLKMAIPAQNQFVFVEFGGRSEIHLTDFAARACMASDCDQQALSLACSFAPAM